jgi:hypothetical protein
LTLFKQDCIDYSDSIVENLKLELPDIIHSSNQTFITNNETIQAYLITFLQDHQLAIITDLQDSIEQSVINKIAADTMNRVGNALGGINNYVS